MARMSTDDSLGRDPRLDHLAELCGWTRRETAGCLQLDVWPLCYDRVTPNIPPGDIDRVAGRGAVSPVKHPGGFSAALVECGLARKSTRDDLVYHWEKDDGSVVDLEWRDLQWRGRVYLKGAADRIAYLLKKQASGRAGGKRSAESRGSSQAVLEAPLEAVLKHTSAELNPSASASASPSVSPPPLVLVSDRPPTTDSPGLAELKRRANRAKRPPSEVPLPDDWAPTDSHRALAVSLRLNCNAEAENFRDKALAKGLRYVDWDAAFRTWLRNARKFADRDAKPSSAQSGFDAVMRIANGDES